MNVNESYSELGLSPNCSDADIKTAWRRLAARWHPDRNASPQALRKIQRINRAVEEIRRSRELRELPSVVPARPVEHTVELTLEEAVAGCIRTLEGEVVDACAPCGGSGVAAQPGKCEECGGAGQVRRHLWFGWMGSLVKCGACEGQGVTRHACQSCAGSGKAPPRRYRCRARIPPGVREGVLLQVPATVRGPEGARKEEISVRVQLQSHAFFELEADGTVKYELPVDGFAWVANRWIEVPTPGGLQQMKLRRDFLVYRIRGQGLVAEPAAPRADCIVTVVPLFPEEFSKEQQALLDRLVASNSKAAGTAAGRRMAAWDGVVEKWQAGLPEQPAQGTRR